MQQKRGARNMKIIHSFYYVLLALACSAYGKVELVRDGRPAADIVISTNPGIAVRWAALDLQEHIKKMSGARLEIASAPLEQFKSHVYVGTSAFTAGLGFNPAAFTNSGFEIIAKDNYVILAGQDILRKASRFMGPAGLKLWHEFCGEKFNYGRGEEGMGTFNAGLQMFTNDDPGTWYAVAELLEQLGVRFYAPYDNGTVIPEMKTIAVAEQHLKKEAAFARREFCYYNAMRQDPEGIKWFKRVKLGNSSIIVYNHTTDDVFGPEEQKKLHPEYLAYGADGKPINGYPSGHGMPRYTDPGFRKAAALYMNKRFDAVPELTAMSISPPDGGLYMDARDVNLYGKPEDDMALKTANYIWDFNVFLAKELKKAHPDKFLLYGSSGTGRGVPTNIEEFPDNMIVPFAQTYSAYRVLESNDNAVIAGRKEWFAKMKTVRKGPIWDYYLYYRTPDRPRFPVFFTEHLQKEVQEMLPYSDGKFIEIQPEYYLAEGDKNPRSRLGNHGLIHLMVYWHSKLFWDPGMDRRQMLEEYYELFFGPARKEMKEFHEYAEEVWMRQESRSVTANSGFLKENDVERFFDILARARKKAGSNSVYDRRIAQMEGEMVSLKKLFPNMKRSGPEFRAYIAREPVVIDGDLKKPLWTKISSWHAMGDLITGEVPDKNQTRVAFRWTMDKSMIVFAVVCMESRMDRVVAKAKNNDDPAILNDDAVEIYIETPERSYFKIAVNSEGKIWDESQDATIVARDTLPNLWNPGIKAVAKKEKDRWLVEISIPAGDFGELGPAQPYMWGFNVCRRRLAGGEPEEYALVPTGTPKFLELSRLGNLWVRY
jgi:hypothetical protein